MNEEENYASQSIPASQYKGQGFQPVAEKVLSHAKNIVKNTKTWRTIFKDNFSLNVKATNVVEVVMASKSTFIAMIMTLCLMQASF